MSLTLLEKIRLKAIYKSCEFMGLEMIGWHLLAPQYISDKSVVFDFGANLGHFATEITNRTKCKCISIEPNPIVFEKIKETEHIQKINAAVSDVAGKLEFFISKNPEASSFVKTIASSWGVQETIMVNTHSYSDLTNGVNVDLLKIDIEGAEIEVLNSMSDQQLLSIPQITVEFHDFIDPELGVATKDVINRLTSLGFLMVNYSLKSFADVLFINPKLISWNLRRRVWYKFHCLFRYNG